MPDAGMGQKMEESAAPFLSSLFTELYLFNCSELLIYLKSNYINTIIKSSSLDLKIYFKEKTHFDLQHGILEPWAPLQRKATRKGNGNELTGDQSTGEFQFFIVLKTVDLR